MNVLVTGATGFVGATLTRRLVADGHAVRVLRRENSKTDLIGSVDVDHFIGDITDPERVLAACTDREIVFHCAAFVGFGGRRTAKRMMQVNVGGTARVVNAALKAGVSRLVHTSSVAALGRPERSEGCIDETAQWVESRYNTAYALSKYQAELEVQRGIAEGLDAVILNPSLVFGGGRTGENTRKIVESIRDGRMPLSPSGGTNVVDVLDVVDGHIHALERGKTGSRYILAGEHLAWPELLGTLAAAFRVSPPRRVVGPRGMLALATVMETGARIVGREPLLTRESARISGRSTCYDATRAQRDLGCSFRPFAETAQRMANEIALEVETADDPK